MPVSIRSSGRLLLGLKAEFHFNHHTLTISSATQFDLFPAREVNAQQKNGGRLVCAAKRQNGGGKSKRALGVPCQLEWGRFCGEGTFISGRLENRFKSRFGTNTKLLRGVFCPISTPIDYPNLVFNDVISLCGSCRNSLQWSLREKL